MNHSQTILRRRFLATTGATCCAAAFAPDTAGAETKSAGVEKFKLIDCHFHINHMRRSVEDTIKHIEVTGTDKAFILPL